ncbi:MAG TPA: 50S ribosomal protein L21 [Ktedonobacterales bacterium]|jgi:large subunit ribosomal protein L21
MYAVIETGGKQYRVTPGQLLEVERLSEDPGETVTLDRVLLVSADGRTLVGKPTVPGARVVGAIAREGRGKKIIVFKFKSKKRYRRKTGHRQNYTHLLITDIQADGQSLVPEDERKRYEASATRMATRYEAKLAGLNDLPSYEEIFGAEDDESETTE